MELRVMLEPQQGASYDDQLVVAQASEAAGFGAFFRSDHFLAMGGSDGLPGPTDAWLTLAALARETTTIRLGTMVASATFRLPGLLAIQAAQVDDMSGGRLELGLGTGWFAAEHEAYGIPFPPLGERFDRFTEQLEIVTGLWGTPAGERFSYAGQHYQLADSPALPKPAQAHVPIVIGGGGAKRTPALAARFADEFNLAFSSVADTAAAFDRVRAAAGGTGRTLLSSACQVLCIGRDDAEVTRRAQAIGHDPATIRADGVAGTVEECLGKLREFAAIGTDRIYLQVLDLHDLEHLALAGRELIGPAASM